ncbi:contractile injection system protein, VgrG/Pvc8 family [Neisseria sp.]
MQLNFDSISAAAQKAAAKIFDEVSGKNARHLTPAAELTIDGRRFGTQAMSRIISISLTDKRGFEADELTIELDDHDGTIAIPKTGSKITLKLGYKETGLVEKGEYLVSEFTASGSPDRLSITARAADLAEALAEQVEKSWHKQTLYQIIETIAKKHKYEYIISKEYQSQKIDHIDQTNESDASFMSRLAEQYDAIATIKNGKLLFIPAGESQTASGQPILPTTITRASGDSHSFTYSSSNSYQAVRAYYTDKKTGQKKEVIVNKDNAYPNKKTTQQTKTVKGKTFKAKKKENDNQKVNTEGQKIKTLRHLYATESGAWSGARGAFKKIQRGVAEFSITLAVGRPDLYPETPAVVQGFKPEIDAEAWLITEVSHKIDSGGYTASIQFEARIVPDITLYEDAPTNNFQPTGETTEILKNGKQSS